MLASDIAPNREILGSRGEYFTAGSVDRLTERLGELLPCLRQMKASAGLLAHTVIAKYDWDSIAHQTERLYLDLLGAAAGEDPASASAGRIGSQQTAAASLRAGAVDKDR